MKLLNIFSLHSIFKISRVFKGVFFLIFTLLFVFFAYAKYDEPNAYEPSLNQSQADITEMVNILQLDLFEMTDTPIDNAIKVASRFDTHKNVLYAESLVKMDSTAHPQKPEIQIEATVLLEEELEKQIVPQTQSYDDKKTQTASVETPKASEEPKNDSSKTEAVPDISSENVITTLSGEQYKYKKVLNMTATAYTYANNELDITASGVPVQVGVVAADFSVIPMNTKVYIAAADGSWEYGYAIVGDTGVSGNVIDIFLETEEECVVFGVKNAVVYILE